MANSDSAATALIAPDVADAEPGAPRSRHRALRVGQQRGQDREPHQGDLRGGGLTMAAFQNPDVALAVLALSSFVLRFRCARTRISSLFPTPLATLPPAGFGGAGIPRAISGSALTILPPCPELPGLPRILHRLEAHPLHVPHHVSLSPRRCHILRGDDARVQGGRAPQCICPAPPRPTDMSLKDDALGGYDEARTTKIARRWFSPQMASSPPPLCSYLSLLVSGSLMGLKYTVSRWAQE